MNILGPIPLNSTELAVAVPTALAPLDMSAWVCAYVVSTKFLYHSLFIYFILFIAGFLWKRTIPDICYSHSSEIYRLNFAHCSNI